MDFSVQRNFGTLKAHGCYGRRHFGTGKLWQLEVLAEMWMVGSSALQCYNVPVAECPHWQNVYALKRSWRQNVHEPERPWGQKVHNAQTSKATKCFQKVSCQNS